jgi:voltage-gated potassium channel
MNKTHRNELLIFLAMIMVLAVGTAGYMITEDGWTAGEALFMTVSAITTVGYGENRPLSPAGHYFTIFLIFSGLGTAALFLSSIAPAIIERSVINVFGKKKMQKRIANLKDHFIVCGFGRLGSSVCSELRGKELPVVVIELRDDLAEQAEKEGFVVLKGNATSETVLKEAGIERAHAIVAGLNSDADNLYISLAARELNSKILIIARSEERSAEKRMLRAGADMIVSPLLLGGRHISEILCRSNVDETPKTLDGKIPVVLGFGLRLFRHPHGIRLTVGEALALSGALRAVALKRFDGSTELLPSHDTKIQQDDALIILTSDDPSLAKRNEAFECPITE